MQKKYLYDEVFVSTRSATAWLGESDLHPVSIKTPVPQYQSIEQKRQGKQLKIKMKRAA